MSTSANGQQLLVQVKAAAGRPGPQLSLPVVRSPAAWLRPVATEKHLQNPDDLRCLTRWRNRFAKSYLTEFEATESRTSDWLARSVGPDNTRILFMVEDSDRRTCGYMGIANIDWSARCGEADAIVRGRDTPRGVMTEALRTLLDWARGQLGLETMNVRVRSDNTALEFYCKMGFVEQKRVPLNQREEPGMTIWYEDPALDRRERNLVYLTLQDEARRP